MNGIRSVVHRQREMAWRLLEHHLEGLDDAECLWRPAPTGLHVHESSGSWVADWPDHEEYDLGPPSIAWLTWHIGFWWSMALDHSFGDGTLRREDVAWPGSVDGVRRWLEEKRDRWDEAVAALPEAELASTERTRWPFRDRPFADVLAWVNAELMKNAAEIGYCRFLHGARHAK